MCRLGHLLHELEIGTHAICQPCHLAELRNEHDLSARLLVQRYNDRLVHISDRSLILGLEVLVV